MKDVEVHGFSKNNCGLCNLTNVDVVHFIQDGKAKIWCKHCFREHVKK